MNMASSLSKDSSILIIGAYVFDWIKNHQSM